MTQYTLARYIVAGTWHSTDRKFFESLISSITEFYFDQPTSLYKFRVTVPETILKFNINMPDTERVYFLRDIIDLELRPHRIQVKREFRPFNGHPNTLPMSPDTHP